ncbi:MAG: hypothetical protein IPM48_10135 [Saprospiraceae bacterium]|nr:hypothetical protein [Saprospiraceae bacterium]
MKIVIIILTALAMILTSCSKESSDTGEGTFYCKIDGTPFSSSGMLLSASTFGDGFKVIAIESVTSGRSVALFVSESSTGTFDLGPSQQNNRGSFFDSYLNTVTYTTHSLDNDGSGTVVLSRNDGKIAIGTFEMNVSNGSRVIRITEGRFHVRYLK